MPLEVTAVNSASSGTYGYVRRHYPVLHVVWERVKHFDFAGTTAVVSSISTPGEAREGPACKIKFFQQYPGVGIGVTSLRVHYRRVCCCGCWILQATIRSGAPKVYPSTAVCFFSFVSGVCEPSLPLPHQFCAHTRRCTDDPNFWLLSRIRHKTLNTRAHLAGGLAGPQSQKNDRRLHRRCLPQTSHPRVDYEYVFVSKTADRATERPRDSSRASKRNGWTVAPSGRSLMLETRVRLKHRVSGCHSSLTLIG